MIYFYSKIYFHIKAIFGKVTPGGGAEEDGKKKKKGTSKVSSSKARDHSSQTTAIKMSFLVLDR